MPGGNRAFETKKGEERATGGEGGGHRSRIPANANARPPESKANPSLQPGCFARLRGYARPYACARAHTQRDVLVCVHAIVYHSQVLAKYARPFVSDLLFWHGRHSTRSPQTELNVSGSCSRSSYLSPFFISRPSVSSTERETRKFWYPGSGSCCSSDAADVSE